MYVYIYIYMALYKDPIIGLVKGDTRRLNYGTYREYGKTDLNHIINCSYSIPTLYMYGDY